MKPATPYNLKCSRPLIGSALAVLAMLLSHGFAENANAGEPYRRFLQKLREERLFDLALVYLEDSQKRSGVDQEFLSAVELERALLYFDSALLLSPKAPQRAEKLNETEKNLRKFIDQPSKHPRRSEARLKLGALLQLRAEEAIKLAGPKKDSGVAEAVKFYDAAHKLYEEAITELAQIENELKGARVDPQDKDKIAYRNQVRIEIREAQLYAAKAIEDRGRSRASEDPQRKADVEKAIELYSSLYLKESGLAGIRTFALLYRSGAQVFVGKTEDAIDGYQRIIDLENADLLRPVQFTALNELVQILASQEKYQPAVERAEAWLSKLRPDERDSSEVLRLQITHAKSRIQWMKKLKEEGETKIASRLDKAVRSDLRLLLRAGGDFADEAKEILSSMGASGTEDKASLEVPKVKNLTEALEESQKRMEDADAESLNIAMMEEQINAAGGQEKQDLTAQRNAQQSQIDQVREVAIEILKAGLLKYDNKKDDRTQLFAARFRMAYLLLKLGDTREAIVVGEFLSRTSPGTPQGLNAGSVVLQGFRDLLNRKDVEPMSVMAELAPYAEFLVATWPQSAEAVAASGALAQLAINAKDWDRAEKNLGILPTSSPGVGKHYFDLGAALYDQYRKMLAEKSTDEAAMIAVRDRAAKWLQLANDNVNTEEAPLVLGSARALAQIRLAQNQTDAAVKLMLDGDKAPMKWLDSKLDQISPASAMEAYRTAMQVVVQQVVEDKVDSDSATKTILGYVAKLQEVGEKSDDDRKRMLAIFSAMATDLKEKLAQLDSTKKRSQLAEVLMVVVEVAAKSDVVSTKMWGAGTLVALAEGTEDKGNSTPTSEKAFAKAKDILQKLVDTNAKQSGYIPANSLNLVRSQYARAAEGMKDYTGAIKMYAEILDENDAFLEIQMSVARVLQKSAQSNPSYYKSAIVGARPNPKTQRNVFWGWGKISQVTNGKMDVFAEQFFEARYQLAYCRMMFGMSMNAKERTKELTAAEKSIAETRGLYPNLGGPEDIKRYDALLKQIQKELGK